MSSKPVRSGLILMKLNGRILQNFWWNVVLSQGAEQFVGDRFQVNDAVGLAFDGFFEQVAGVTAVAKSAASFVINGRHVF